jgi:hypothetical protein
MYWWSEISGVVSVVSRLGGFRDARAVYIVVPTRFLCVLLTHVTLSVRP